MHVVLKYFVSLQRADERYISGFLVFNFNFLALWKHIHSDSN